VQALFDAMAITDAAASAREACMARGAYQISSRR
jgi:hypothetical protein